MPLKVHSLVLVRERWAMAESTTDGEHLLYNCCLKGTQQYGKCAPIR